MPAPRRWVIGRGLLGLAVDQAAPDAPFVAAVGWHDPDVAVDDLAAALDLFAEHVGADWEIYWCAGKGVTSTPAAALRSEVDVFERFVDLLLAHHGLDLAAGRLFLASSVGGVYAGAPDPPFSERTEPAPLSAYGEAKLAMEAVVARASAGSALRTLVGRITNLYGPAQDLAKAQGLISVIVSSYVTGRPTSIYVPLDTLRDYLYADDCGQMVTAGMRRLSQEPPGTSVTKIFGSMNAWSIGAVLGETARIRRVRAPIVSGQAAGAAQASDLRVRSVVWREIDGLARTTLPEGLGALYRAQLRSVMTSGTG